MSDADRVDVDQFRDPGACQRPGRCASCVAVAGAAAGPAKVGRRLFGWLPLSLLLVAARLVIADDAPQSRWLTDDEFAAALAAPISVLREQGQLREQLHRLGETRDVAGWLDCRVDPSLPVSLQVRQQSYRYAIESLAVQADLRVGSLGSTLLLGREAELDRLLTLAAARRVELKLLRDVSATRKRDLLRTRTLRWDEPEQPRQLLERIAADWGVSISNIEAVPHDLWAGGTLVAVDVAEACAFVLDQCDLGFEWTDDGGGIAVTPPSEIGKVGETHRPQGRSLAEAREQIAARWPNVVVSTSGTTLRVEASVLTHAAIRVALGELPDPTVAVVTESVPLSRKRFPVRIVRKPLGPVLEAMIEQGLDIRYDAAALSAAGVNLQQLVSVEFENATADELFGALCQPAGLEYEINGATVTLRPK
ncbi:MAG: hypothetical protein R3B90_00860 [Planctomycetaceae bacterium]